VVVRPRLAQVRLQDRRRGLLDLEDQRVGGVGTLEVDDPAARAHASHPDDLAGEVEVAVAVQDLAAVMGKAPAVRGEGLVQLLVHGDVADAHEQRRLILEPADAVHLLGQLVQRPEAVAPRARRPRSWPRAA
jgi:hypothetical protein